MYITKKTKLKSKKKQTTKYICRRQVNNIREKKQEVIKREEKNLYFTLLDRLDIRWTDSQISVIHKIVICIKINIKSPVYPAF